ncbi:hypothetical protein BKA70DRAFT_1347657 [Coprinopsis sp. MPI-PUGE-AT-0042]|nr:hypothetical protein BKA70DRAFT_1347657 [Coprinopsis sp. MPI-PUGE-AT-0042]
MDQGLDTTNVTDFLPKFRSWTSHSPEDRRIISAAAAETETKLGELQRLLLWQKSACAPIRLLPLEILTRILWFVIPSVSLHYDAVLAPWNIGAVCKYWRDVLYSTPGLWNHITVDAEKLSSQDHSARLCRFLSLSQSLLLYVDFGMSNGFFSEFSSNPLVRLLAEEHHRWAGKISGPFLCACSRFRPTLDVIPNDTFPLVTSVEDGEPANIFSLFMWVQRSFKFPNLRRLALSGLPGELASPGLTVLQRQIKDVLTDSVQYQLLTTLELNDPEHTFAAVNVLGWPHINNLTSLHHLILRGGKGPFISAVLEDLPPWDQFDPITLHHIRKLSLHGYPVHLLAYLTLLITPSLVDLELDAQQEVMQEVRRFEDGEEVNEVIYSGIDDEQIPSGASILLERSHCAEKIQSLSLRGAHGNNLGPMIKQMPNIRKLLVDPEAVWNIDSLHALDEEWEELGEGWAEDDHEAPFKPLSRLQQMIFVMRGHLNRPWHDNMQAQMAEFLRHRSPNVRICITRSTDPGEWVTSGTP